MELSKEFQPKRGPKSGPDGDRTDARTNGERTNTHRFLIPSYTIGPSGKYSPVAGRRPENFEVCDSRDTLKTYVSVLLLGVWARGQPPRETKKPIFQRRLRRARGQQKHCYVLHLPEHPFFHQNGKLIIIGNSSFTHQESNLQDRHH